MLVLCPYDTIRRSDGRVGRRCAMARHIPIEPNINGATWSEVETLNNHTVVDVQAPQAILNAILADPDFIEIKPGSAIVNKLRDLGFTGPERNGLPTDPSLVKAYLKQFRSQISMSADGQSIVVGGRR